MRPALSIALLLTLAASAWVAYQPLSGEEDAVIEPAAGPAPAAAAQRSPGRANGAVRDAPLPANEAAPAPAAPARQSLAAARDLFPVQRPPEPPAARVEPASAPPPPPPPSLSLIGRVVEDATPVAIVRNGDGVLTLRVGDTVQGFRVAAITDRAIELVHPDDGRRHVASFAAATAAAGGASPFRPARGLP